MPIGKVKFFNSVKGYGFIQPQDGGKDAFVHISAVERAGMATLQEGQTIRYDLTKDSTGRPTAANIEMAGPHGTGDDPRG